MLPKYDKGREVMAIASYLVRDLLQHTDFLRVIMATQTCLVTLMVKVSLLELFNLTLDRKLLTSSKKIYFKS